MTVEYRESHPHVAGQPEGSKLDKKLRPDVASGMPSGAPGHHFPPMIMNAPILGLTTHHDTIACPHCNAGILWNGAPVAFTCKGCGGVVDKTQG